MVGLTALVLPEGAAGNGMPRATGLVSFPSSSIAISTTSPASRVNGAGGTRHVPVDRTTPSGCRSARHQVGDEIFVPTV